MKIRTIFGLILPAIFAISANSQTLEIYKNGINLFASTTPTNGTVAEISTDSPFEGVEHFRFSYNCVASAANVWLNFAAATTDFRDFTHVQIAVRGMAAGDKAQMQLQSQNGASGNSIDILAANAVYTIVKVPIWSLKGFTSLDLEKITKLNIKLVGGSAASSGDLFFDALELVIDPASPATNVYKSGTTLVTGTWNVDGTVAETSTNSPFEGGQHYQFVYNVGSDGWAGFGLNMNGWGSSAPRNFDGASHLRIAVRGLTAGHSMTFQLKTLSKTTQAWTLLGDASATYQVLDIPLPIFTGVSGLDRRLVTEFQFNVSAPANGAGTVYFDAIEILNAPKPPASTAWARANSLEKGFNLNNWLEAYWLMPFGTYPEANVFTKASLTFLQSTGYNHVRMPVVFGRLTGPAPGYALTTAHPAYALVDSVINWTDQLGMKLIIDYHHDNPQISNANFAAQQVRLCAIWRQLAQRYNYLDPARVFFEINNEPNGISNTNWRNVQKAVLDTIRLHSPNRTIVAGATGWNSSEDLLSFEPYSHDLNVIYTYHHYSPFDFTHQLASWLNPPPPARAFPIGDDIQDLWDKNAMLDIWSDFYDHPYWMGEMGCIGHADAVSRCNWIETIGEILDTYEHPWTYWDVRLYPDGFGYYPGGLAPGNGIACFLSALHLTAGTALAVEVSQFEASCSGGSTELVFTLFSTENGTKTIIERSPDGFDWEKIGESQLAEGEKTYRYLDEKSPAGGAFYRLRQIEADGSGSISSIARADCGSPISMKFYPNPVVETGQVTIESDGQKTARIAMVAADGRVVHSEVRELLRGANEFKIDFSGMPGGVYWVVAELEGATAVLAQRVVK